MHYSLYSEGLKGVRYRHYATTTEARKLSHAIVVHPAKTSGQAGSWSERHHYLARARGPKPLALVPVRLVGPPWPSGREAGPERVGED